MAQAKTKTVADIEKEAIKESLDYITSDGSKKKQGEKVVKKVFGLTIETNY